MFLHELIRFSQATQVSYLNRETFPPGRSYENFDLTSSSHFFNVFMLVVFAIFSTAHLTILSIFLCCIWPGVLPFKTGFPLSYKIIHSQTKCQIPYILIYSHTKGQVFVNFAYYLILSGSVTLFEPSQ